MSTGGEETTNSVNTNNTNNSQSNASGTTTTKISLDQIAAYLLKQNFVLTALELHTELAESGREVPRLRDFFSNPANFEQQQASASGGAGYFPLHKASSVQTFDSLDLTRYSDDADQNKVQDDKIAVLEFELRKAKETINQLRNTLTLATEGSNSNNHSKSSLNALSAAPNQATNDTNSTQINPTNKSQASSNNNKPNEAIFNLTNDDDYASQENEDEYDYIEGVNSETTNETTIRQQQQHQQHHHSSKATSNKLMPHEKNAINFLINEYLLENSYKMTSITFAEENESQDLEDWDVIGLNRAKPPNLLHLYRNFLNKGGSKKDVDNKGASLSKSTSIEAVVKCDASCQVDPIQVESVETNTNLVEYRDFESLVNFDRDTFDTQRTQINKLLEKQGILIKSLSKLENDITALNIERESSLKKIDLLKISLEKANMTIKNLNEQEEAKNKTENSQDLNNPDEVVDSSEKEKNLIDEESNIQELNEKKIPVVFKEILTKYQTVKYNETNQRIIEETTHVKLEYQSLVPLLNKYLPQLIPFVDSSEKRLQFLPIILTLSILEQDDIMKHKTKKDCVILRLLFNLIEKPTFEERSIIEAICVQFTKYAGPMYANNYLLPLCWEQLNEKTTDEKRMLVAETCATLAPHIYNDMRSSLIFSILKQLIEEETCDSVRACAVRSLAILINYINDEKKFPQCIELLDLCATDSSREVVEQVERLLMPCLSLWALNMNKFMDPLMNHLAEKANFHILNSNRQKHQTKKNESSDQNNLVDHEQHSQTYMKLLNLNFQFAFALVLINFRESPKNELELELTSEENNEENLSSGGMNKLPKLNSYFHSLQEKLALGEDGEYDLYKIDSILEDYLSLTVKYLGIIESDSWTSDELAASFAWLSDTLLRKLIQMSVQVEARDKLCSSFVNVFRSFTLLFAIDYELIKSKIIPIFEKLLNIPTTNEVESNQQAALDQIINSKSSPIFKSTLPVYFVGILSTLVDVEMSGWFTLNSDLVQDLSSYKSKSGAANDSIVSGDKIINSSQYTPSSTKNSPQSSGAVKSSLDKRLDYMNTFLKNVFFSLSLNQANLDGMISIYELMKLKSKTADYVIQMLLSTLWDGIVHNSLYVRCNTAKLFEILVKDCDEYLLSTRILPALITLANDLDKMVRCSSVSPLTSIIENCHNREILERVFTQMQSFLSDPILKDDYMLQIELLKSFRRISTRVNAKFREEMILPYLTIVTIQIKNVITENDYEFTMSAITSAYLSIDSSNLTQTSSASVASISSIGSKSSDTTTPAQQHNHQQDVMKICVLLFDIYQKLCLTTSLYHQTNEEPSPIQLSRQSTKESILPGLTTLKDIFQNKVIQASSSQHHNDFLNTIDSMMHRVESMQFDSSSPSVNTTLNRSEIANSNSPLKVSPNPIGLNTTGIVSDLVSASVSSLSSSISSATAAASETITNTANADSNFKSLVFKGISNFSHSKDKLSNLLANKNMKKT